MGFRSYASTNIWCGLFLFLAFAIFPAIVHGQESGREWRSATLNNSETVYSTQEEIERALNQASPFPGKPFVIEKQLTTETQTTITYWRGVHPAIYGQWGNYDNQFISPVADESTMVSATVAALNEYSNDPYCNTSSPYYRNATFVPTGSWVVWTGGGGTFGGQNVHEYKSYRATYLRASGSSSCIVDTPIIYVHRTRTGECPASNSSLEPFSWFDSYKGCVKPFEKVTVTTAPLVCEACGHVGNPADVTTGDKFEPEPDFDLGWFSFVRYFHSAISNGAGGFGYGWTHSQNSRLAIAGQIIALVRPDGYQLPFRKVGTTYEAIDGSGDRIASLSGQWKLYQANKVTTFDANGRLLGEVFEDGTSTAYAYDPNFRLSKVTHSTGRSVEFQYAATGPLDDPRMVSITSGGVILVGYVYTPDRRLDSVVHADGKTRRYHYEDPRFPLNLTGITAEDEQRFSTFTYDAKGRVVSSAHAGNADQVSLVYAPEGGALVTDALGRQSDYDLTPGGTNTKYRKVTGVTDSAGTVGRTHYEESVDFRRRLDTYTDRNGVQTKHTYAEATDAVTGALASIHITTEALGMPQQRVREEHRDAASNRLIMTKASTRETRYTRNARLQPTAVAIKDTATENTRTATMTYCEQADVTAGSCPLLGLLKSVDGPRTDVSDITTYTYYPSDEATCAAAPATCPHRKGDLWKVTNALGQVTETLKYDLAGRTLSVKDANGVITDYDYHPRGWLTARKVRDTNDAGEGDDLITRIEYWPTGLVRQVTQPDGTFVAYAYDAAQRLTDAVDDVGNRIHYALDNAGNRLKEDTQDPGGVLKRTLSRVYDQLGQLQIQKDAQLNPIGFTYDPEGNTDTLTDALGRVIDNDYDPLGRLKRTLEDTGGIAAETQYAHDAQDNLVGVTDPKGLSTAYTYNGLGDLTQLVSPDTGTTLYTYDSGGNRRTQTDARGITATYAYDALNRLIAITYPDAALNVAYTYDTGSALCSIDQRFHQGRLAQLTDGSGSTQYCYDRFGNLTRKHQLTQGQSFEVKYLYPSRPGCYPGYCIAPRPRDQLQTIEYPGGLLVSYLYTQGRISSIQVTPSGGYTQVLLENITYHAFGPPASWRYGNGRVLQRPLDQDYRPMAVVDSNSGGLDLGFGYDAAGNLNTLSSAANAAPLISFGYDALSRLTEVRDGPTQTAIDTYAYDATGNRTATTNSAGTTAYTYEASSHRLIQVGSLPRHYDTAGNTTAIGTAPPMMAASTAAKAKPSVRRARALPSRLAVRQMERESVERPFGMRGRQAPLRPAAAPRVQLNQPAAVSTLDTTPRQFVYDASNRLAQVRSNGAVTQDYRYNGNGEQVLRSDPAGNRTTAVYDEAGHWLADYDNNGTPIQQVIWLGDLPVGLIADNKVHYIEPDHLGTPRVVIEPARNVAVWTWDLKGEAFGNSVPNQDPDGDTNPFILNMRFPGQRHDAASGLNYNYLRDYDTGTGRYVESDPIGLKGGGSTYSYTSGNPVLRSDSLGLRWATAGQYEGRVNTIVCDGSGGIEPAILPVGPSAKSCGLYDCVMAHEQSHASDALRSNPRLCAGKQRGTQIRILSNETRRQTEIDASNVEIECLKSKLMQNKCGPCDEIINNRIKRMENYRDSF